MSAITVSRPTAKISPAQADGFLLKSESELADAVRHAVDRAMALGADQAGAYVNESGGVSIKVADGAVETASRDGSHALEVTVWQKGRTGTASTESLNTDALNRVVEQALAIAQQLEPDPDAGLPDKEALAWTTPLVPLFAPSGQSASDLVAAAMEVEAGALEARADGAARIVEAGAASRDMRWALANSHGFCRSGSASVQQRWCVGIAEQNGALSKDYWVEQDRRLEHLASDRFVGQKAVYRALRKVGATTPETQRASVLFDATIASSLVQELCQALMGGAQYKQTTFLPNAIGKQATATHLGLVEDPFEPYGMASETFDDEGVAGARRDIVAEGQVQGLFVATRMARKLGMASTGNAGGLKNLTLTSRNTSPEDDLSAMLRKLGDGLWLTEFLGGGVNPISGAYSKAACGFWIKGGEIVGPVQNFTVGGSFLDMMAAVVAVGADVHRSGAIRTGSILIENMQIAGGR